MQQLGLELSTPKNMSMSLRLEDVYRQPLGLIHFAFIVLLANKTNLLLTVR
jgi:hypothetical protein